MECMLHHAIAFNQDISSWDVRAVTNNKNMWDGATADDGRCARSALRAHPVEEAHFATFLANVTCVMSRATWRTA